MENQTDLRTEIISTLRDHQTELMARGFKHIAIFGSVARGQARADSDVDLLVELDRSKRLGLEYFGVLERIEEILGRRIDVVTLPVRKERLRATIENDRVDAF